MTWLRRMLICFDQLRGKETRNNVERKKNGEKEIKVLIHSLHRLMCAKKLSSPAGGAALFLHLVRAPAVWPHLPPPLHHHRHRHSLCVFARDDSPHLDERRLLCVLVIYRTSAAAQWSTARGPGRFLEGAVVFAECFVWAKKNCLWRRAAGEAKCCSLSRVFASLVSSSREVVPLSVAHLSTSGCTDCVWLFPETGWDATLQ